VAASFASVIIQIMLLDIVFSLDSVITAIGIRYTQQNLLFLVSDVGCTALSSTGLLVLGSYNLPLAVR